MLGGGHVRGRSVGFMVEAWRCPQAEKRKHLAVDISQPNFNLKDKRNAKISKPSHRLRLPLTL